MTETIIVAIITGGLSLLGVIITSNKTTREVREHNNFARRVPVLEEQIKVINHRIADLEQSHQ